MPKETTEELFDCVICGQASTSTEDRPIGLVTLLQPSAGEQTILKKKKKKKTVETFCTISATFSSRNLFDDFTSPLSSNQCCLANDVVYTTYRNALLHYWTRGRERKRCCECYKVQKSSLSQ